MNLDITGIIQDKLNQLDADGIIQKKIEETVEKSVLRAITSELESYSFMRGIENQVKESVSSLAADCGFSAYNGFIAKTTKAIVQEMFTEDIAEKVRRSLDNALLKKYSDIKLSDIFNRYREWVLENTEESEKYEREHFTCELEVKEDGRFTHYTCRFSDRPIEKNCFGTPLDADIEVRFCIFSNGVKESTISMLYLDGHNMRNSIKIGTLTPFEAFLVNLYYSDTKVILDADDVDDDDSFDIDW